MKKLEAKEIQYFKNFGYDIFGPLLLTFIKWLINELEEKNVKKVYFLSRDGYIMKKSFDIINTNTNIKSTYFYASRRSIIIPSLWKIDSGDKIFECIKFNKKISIMTFLKKVGLEDNIPEESIKKYKYKLSNIENTQNRSQHFKDFIDEILPIIKENSKREFTAFNKYVEQNNFCDKVAIVDIGWHGSMQESLNSIINNINIYGYYFGLVPNNKICNEKSYGFLFDEQKNEELYNKMHYFINIFEFLFLAQHGSVKRFTNDGEIEFYDYEYQDTKEQEIVKIIQDSALKYINDNKETDVSKEMVIKKFFKKFLSPKYIDAVNFGNIRFNDDTFKDIAKPKRIYNYLISPKSLYNDYINSSWRIGFLKRLIKIPFPYYKLNQLIRKFLKKEV